MNKQLKDDLQVLFEQVSVLINRYEAHDPGFVDSVKRWFRDVEAILKKYEVPQISELAGMRGMIIAAEDGVRDPAFIVDPGVRSSKIPAAVAAISLKRAQDILHMVMEPYNRTLDEAQKIMRKVLVISGQSGLLIPFYNPDGSLKVPVADLWRYLVEVANIGDGLMRVLSLISFEDAVCLMAECLDTIPLNIFKKNLPSPSDEVTQNTTKVTG